MRLEFHALARSDVSRIMDHYEDAGGPELADEFYAELWSYFNKAVSSPESYATRHRDIRRVNLKRFPFHFLYRTIGNRIRHIGDSPSSKKTFTGNAPTLRPVAIANVSHLFRPNGKGICNFGLVAKPERCPI